jgi:hypothetical protein
MLDLSWLEISSHWQECRDGKDPGMAIIPEAVLESTRGSTGQHQGQYWRVPECSTGEYQSTIGRTGEYQRQYHHSWRHMMMGDR